MNYGRMMRAARFVQPRCIKVEAAPLPEPAATEVRMRIEGCGVCSSNLAAWQGSPWLQYPLAPGEPGHESWGRVDRIGRSVNGARIGERCAFLSSHGFAEYAIADAATLVPLPPDTQIFPGEALGCAINIFRRSKIASDQRVAIVGVGFLGALLVRMASRTTGVRVFALSQREYSLQLARRFGAHETIRIETVEGAAAQLIDRTCGEGCERVIEAAGTQPSLDLASALVRTGGRLIIAGYHQDGPRRVNMQSWNWRGIDVINAHERSPERYVAGMRDAAAQIATGNLDPSPLYTHGFSLDQCAAAFELLEARPPGFVKAWIRPD
jgi:threonine dehydrogenase-like Zn-dependent dehydrogenase